MKEDVETYEKKIFNLENENKIMTEKILSKANTMLNSTITFPQPTIPRRNSVPARSWKYHSPVPELDF